MLLVLGCASQTRKRATEGAVTGGIAGAVGGFVTSAIFGGDPLRGAARGATFGAAAGATAGAIQGSREAKAQEQASEAELARIRQLLGDDAYRGLEALAECHHAEALASAERARASSVRDHMIAGLWLEALTYADQGQEPKARALYPTLIERDPETASRAEAEQTLRETLNGLMDIRAEYALPRVCPA